jgi:putative membrane protein
MVLTLIAAPLLVLGRADLLVRALLGQTFDYVSGRSRANLTLCIGGVCFTAAIWTWHLPTPYDATLENNMVYWTMHVTTMAAALVLWHGLLTLGSEAVGGALIIGFGTAMQMSLLGAILTFARRDLFSVHLATTWPWGLSPLEDQQLGGLIMWVPAGLVFTLYGLMAFGLWLHRFAVLRRPLA